ncbi:MAG: AraC family transcriptional regulator [Chloroflexota bacterium]
MIYTMHTPQPPLTQFVDCFWFVSGTTHYKQEKVLPGTSIDLMFNLGAYHKVYDNADTARSTTYQDAWISGLQTDYIMMEAVAETEMYGIRFKPGGAYPFFQMPIAAFRNQVVEMDSVWGHLVAEIREQLAVVDTLQQRFAVLEQILLRKLRQDLYGLDAVQFAVQAITQLDHFSSVKALSEQMGLSQKHLIDQFHKMVGLSPKQFARIVKFNQVLQAIDATKPVNWAEIALDCHYYDQAHFNRDFKAFCGFSPSTYLALRKKFWGRNLEQGEFTNFVPIR